MSKDSPSPAGASGHAREQSAEQLLEKILRGAARLVGCNSTNLIVMDERRNTIRVRVGVTEVDYPVLAEMESLLGMSFRGISAPLETAVGGLLHQVWRDGRARETDSLAQMVGGAIPAQVIEGFEALIGPHRYMLVPAAGRRSRFGVLVFEKGGSNPFSRQQRSVLARYARRIGDILERGLRSVPQLEDLLEEALDPLEATLLRLTVSEPAPALFCDRHLRITSANEALATLLGGLPEATPVGLERLFADARPIVRLLNQQALYPNSWLQEVEAVVRRHDGHLLQTTVEALLLADEQNRVEGFLLLVRPREGAHQPDTGADQQERLATMGELAAQLAHEVRNPLVAIGAALERLAGSEERPERRRELEVLVQEIGRLDQVLKKFLGPRMHLVAEPVCLAELVDDVLRMLGGLHPAGARLLNRLERDLKLEADQDALRQLYFNLLTNALEVSPPESEIVCRGEARGTELWLTVEDRGPGLPAEPERCLEPFFSTKRNGTGLGLTVCRRIVEAHGGVLRLGNRSQGGCRVEIVVPRRARLH